MISVKLPFWLRIVVLLATLCIVAGAGLVTLSFEELQGTYFLAVGEREKGRSMLLALADKLHAQQGPDEWSEALFAMARMARQARSLGDWGYILGSWRQASLGVEAGFWFTPFRFWAEPETGLGSFTCLRSP